MHVLRCKSARGATKRKPFCWLVTAVGVGVAGFGGESQLNGLPTTWMTDCSRQLRTQPADW